MHKTSLVAVAVCLVAGACADGESGATDNQNHNYSVNQNDNLNTNANDNLNNNTNTNDNLNNGGPQTFCGDGVVDTGEECDLGASNGQSPSPCLSDCTLTTCGDGYVGADEQCDEGAQNSNTVPDACRADCRLPSCGDGVVDSTEVCDGSALAGQTCDTRGYNAGALACEADCLAFDESACTGVNNCTVDLPVGLVQSGTPQNTSGTLITTSGDENDLSCNLAGSSIDQVISFFTAQPGNLTAGYDFGLVPPTYRFLGLYQAGTVECTDVELGCQSFTDETGTIDFGPLSPGDYYLIVEEMVPLGSSFTVTLTLTP